MFVHNPANLAVQRGQRDHGQNECEHEHENGVEHAYRLHIAQQRPIFSALAQCFVGFPVEDWHNFAHHQDGRGDENGEQPNGADHHFGVVRMGEEYGLLTS